MSDLKLAMPTIFLHEGGLVDNAKDPGGITNFGISLRFLLSTGDLDHDGWEDGDINHDHHINAEDIKLMTPDGATKLYDLYFWTPNQYERINDQPVATKVFDLCVNIGKVGANKCLQRAVRATSGFLLIEDGFLGQQSFNAINACNAKELLASLKSEAAGYYRKIKYNGSQDFLTGWLNRAYSDMVVAKV